MPATTNSGSAAAPDVPDAAADAAADTAAIRAADEQRCAAIGNRDRAALSATLSENLSYLHSTGQRDGKESYIVMSIEETPRTVGRGETEVLLYGDIAVVRGDYQIHIEPDADYPDGRHTDASGLQVWRREDGTWRLFLHQGTAYPKPAAPPAATTSAPSATPATSATSAPSDTSATGTA